MKLIRTCMFALAVLLPTSWTLAHAADEGADKSGGEMKKEGKKKSKKEKKGEGDMGKGDMDKK